ncbi:MAG: ChbG/HpnK family deacetylase, partial [Verrucomicrobiota bacterium]
MNSRRLVVNADDFGRSRSINEAVIRAHRDGILTSASLMVNEV